MDKALLLKKEFDKGKELTEERINQLLHSSELVKKLTSDFSEKSLFPIWRLISLAEIPYAEKLKYTQNLIEYIENTYVTSDGFSITGKDRDLLPCYNAMLVEALSKLGFADEYYVTEAVDWIKKYQVFERGAQTSWTGKGIEKYGGCMKNTPCYIGIAKTVKALIYYNESVSKKDDEVIALISKGMNYILSHNLYQRLRDSEPITNHILDIAYPQSYQLNIVELLDMAYMTNTISHPSVKSAIECVNNKKTKDGYWKISHIYKADGFISFDNRGVKAEWVSYLLDKYLG